MEVFVAEWSSPRRGIPSELPAGHAQLNSRQACSLILLTFTLVGSCMALAVRTLFESGSRMVLMLL